MDVQCRHCGEPLDHTELNGSRRYTPAEAFQLFKKHGCGSLSDIWGTTRGEAVDCTHAPIETPERLAELAERWDWSECVDTYYEAR